MYTKDNILKRIERKVSKLNKGLEKRNCIQQDKDRLINNLNNGFKNLDKLYSNINNDSDYNNFINEAISFEYHIDKISKQLKI